MRKWLLVLAVVAIWATASASSAAAADPPEFKLGFKALADQIPDIVGQPLEAEHYGPNGDSLQQTTTGMMVWRKADNWTAFTDGYQTWVNGPEGLQVRLNDERFPWESDTPAPEATASPTPAPSPAPQPTATPAPTPQPTATPAPSPTPVPSANLSTSQPNVIQGEGLQADSVWVLGEVHNDGPTPAYNVTVSARLRSSTGELAGSGTQMFDYLGPGDTIGYRVEIQNPTTYATAEASATGRTTGYAQYGTLPVTWVKNENVIGSQNAGSRFEFSGTVTSGGTPSSANGVYVWFLNDQNQVVWMDYTYITDTLTPGNDVSFLIRTPWSRDNPAVTSITQVRYYAAGRQS